MKQTLELRQIDQYPKGKLGIRVKFNENGLNEYSPFSDGWELGSPMYISEVDYDLGSLLLKRKDGYEAECVDESQIIPLLNPLYRLTQQITVEGYNDGKPFVPLVRLFDLPYEVQKTYYDVKNGWKIRYVVPDSPDDTGFIERWVPSNTDSIPLWMANKLYSWLFDIERLIEKGLALPIDSVNK